MRPWLESLPVADPAFAPLRWATILAPEDAEALERAHASALHTAAQGCELDELDARAEALRAFAAQWRERDKAAGGTEAVAVRGAEVVAIGYALGVTAARVAIRARTQDAMGVAA